MHRKATTLATLYLSGLITLLLWTAQTRGAEPIAITEFLADNTSGLLDEDGDFSDWVEIYNSGVLPVNLAGWYLTDDPNNLTKWVFPNTNLLASGFLVVFASGKNRAVAGAPLHANFSLAANGEYLALVKPDGSSIASEFASQFPEQFPNISYGLGQNVSVTRLIGSNAPVRVAVPTDGSLGLTWTATSFNDATWTAGTNGVGYETSVAGFAVRNFKANTLVGDLATADNVIANIALQAAVYSENRGAINYLNTGGSANYGGDNTFPGFIINVDQEDFVLEATATITIPSAGNWTFGVNSDDGFRLNVGSFVASFPNPRGPADTLATFNFPVAGDYSLRLVFYERGGGAEVELFAASGSFAAWNPTNFRLVGDTANGGLSVRAPAVGGGPSDDPTYRPLIKTDVQSRMFGVNGSCYLRIPLNVTNAAALDSLTLQVKYDDGFVAYLNGTEVARRNAPAAAGFNSLASASNPDTSAIVYENVNLTSHLGLLSEGANVLALHGLNAATTSSDFLIVAELAEFKATATSNTYFATPTPGGVNLSSNVAYVADTKFSHDRGFYSNAFSLTLTSATPGVTLRYTTNGSGPTLANGFTYAAPIPITRTTTIRAAAFRSGFQPSNVDTHTYIFVEDVVAQQPNGAAPWPEWPAPNAGSGSQVYDYGMDPDVVTNPLYASEIKANLKAIPTFSIVTALSNLFNPANGIYQNPSGEGAAWERPCSLELIQPDGTSGFQIDCGLRLRGGFSRSPDNPKHAFRFFFRQEYGATKLKYNLFPRDPTAAEEFDKFDLRTFQNYSWSFGGDPNGFFLRDQLSRDMQLAMGQQGERGDFYHLYINGVYWGLYNTDERPEASFAASYYGGAPEDYDVIKVDPQLGYTIEATDGNTDAWFRLWQAATNGFASNANYQKVQGNNPDGTRNPAYENLLDVPGLIDYMLVILYGGNLDAPISNFLGNTSPNNWYGSRSRLNTGGFRFFAHDSEHTILNVNADRTGPYPAGNPSTGGGFPKSNPQYVWQQLQANTEFRLLVADRLQKHFFNDGACTVSNSVARFLTRSNEIYHAVVAESARWGDAKRPTAPLTRADWLNAMANAMNFLLNRNAVLLNQLRADGLFPTLGAPTFSPYGGSVPLGYALVLSHPNASGQILYTLDEADPRLPGGAIHPSALVYQAPIVITQFRRVRARVKDGATWSPVVEANFYPEQDFSELLLTEIMYNPPAFGVSPGDDLEFLELKNTGLTTLDLSGTRFTNGINFQFTNGTRLAAGAFFVLARTPTAFAGKYPGVAVGGAYTGRLDNNGETLELVSLFGAPILGITYGDRAPWPMAPDNQGFALVPLNPNANPDPDDPANWRASRAVGGSPGGDDSPAGIAPIIINEVLTHTDPPQTDAIELRNPLATNVNIGGWFLTDDPGEPKKFRIPDNTFLGSGGYVTFTESHFNPAPGMNGSFSLGSTGDEVYLLSGDATTNLTGYSHGFSFGAAANGVSFGRYVNSVGDEYFPAQTALTFGAANSGPRVGPVVCNEVMYHPDAGGDEFIELYNITSNPVPLFDPAHSTNTWKLNGLGYSFPPNITLPAFGFLLLAPTSEAAFRAKYGVPAGVQILGPYPGALQDSGENLQLQRPDIPNTNGSVPYITVDEVRYNDKLPWPVAADGAGPSLQRRIAAHYGNEPTNWFASGITPGGANSFNVAPAIAITAPANNSTFAPPVNVTFTATASDPDGVVTQVEFFANGAKVGQASSLPFTATWTNATPGTHTVTAHATDDDSAVTISEPITVIIFQPIATTAVARGSAWKYLDNGSNPSPAWTQVNFNDSGWSSGAAQLGYGDGDEATTVVFGPDPANRYITTYFRKTFVVNNAARFLSLVVNVLRDDGAVVYLNNVEVFRSNMPQGPVAFNTLASGVVSGGDETSIFYGTDVSPALLLNGTNLLAVEIHQSSGGSTDISFDLELTGTLGPVAPVVNIISPTHNATFTQPANILISALAGDLDGQVAGIDFYQNGALIGTDATDPFNLPWSNVTAGNYALTAVARNDGGLSTTSAPVNIRVVVNAAPTVALTSPTNGAVFHSPASLTLAAAANDAEGSVTLVEFFVDESKIGQTSGQPFTAVWSSPTAGLHALIAVATDNENASRTSAVVTVTITSLTNTPAVLIPSNATWKYLATGVDQGMAWRTVAYSDSGWSNGVAQLGFGDGDEATVINGGPVETRFPTIYFRRAFVVSDAGRFSSLFVNVLRDDGAVVYLNGVEIFRSNMPQGPISFASFAAGTVPPDDETTIYYGASVPPNGLINGTNIIAVEVHQANGTSTDLSFDLALTGELSPEAAPSIAAPPASQTVIVGQTASFSVTAIGAAPLSYQWRFNGAALPQATNFTLALPGVQAGQAGNYSVVVTNSFGAVTSAVATLTVLVPPAITIPPANQTVIAGNEASFSVTATGTPPLRYQWRFNGAAIAGASNTAYSIFNAQPANEGNYSVVVTNAAGASTSVVAILTVLVPPSIVAQPANQTTIAGSGASFSVIASGTAPLHYQWRFNGAPLPDATNVSYALPAVQPPNAGNYTVVISNTVAAVTSEVATLTVLIPPGITSQPSDQTVSAGHTAAFSVTAQGSAPLSYQWAFNDVLLAGATNAILTLTNVQGSQAGSYTVGVNNSAGSLTSAPAQLTVLLPPFITAQPTNLAVPLGSSALFSVSATGTAPLHYQWRFHGTNLADATNALLAFSAIETSHLGDYNVSVTNVAGSVTSTVAVLTIINADSDGDGMPDTWETAHGLNPASNDAGHDPDHDGLSNLDEYRSGTDPQDAASALRVELVRDGTSSWLLRFTAVSNLAYTVQWRGNAAIGPWTKLSDVPSAATNRTIVVPLTASETERYYRAVTPAQ